MVTYKSITEAIEFLYSQKISDGSKLRDDLLYLFKQLNSDIEEFYLGYKCVYIYRNIVVDKYNEFVACNGQYIERGEYDTDKVFVFYLNKDKYYKGFDVVSSGGNNYLFIYICKENHLDMNRMIRNIIEFYSDRKVIDSIQYRVANILIPLAFMSKDQVSNFVRFSIDHSIDSEFLIKKSLLPEIERKKIPDHIIIESYESIYNIFNEPGNFPASSIISRYVDGLEILSDYKLIKADGV